MVTAEVKAFSPIRHGPDQDRLVGSEIVSGVTLRQFTVDVTLNWDKVKDRSREVRDRVPSLMSHVASHGKGLSDRPPGS